MMKESPERVTFNQLEQKTFEGTAGADREDDANDPASLNHNSAHVRRVTRT